jgi:hypothetical protein
MGATLPRASIPRDGVGRVDLAEVDRSLAAIRGETSPRPITPSPSSALLDRLASLGAEAPARRNGHEAPPAPRREAIGRDTRGPIAPEVVAARPASPTDVRGVGRIRPAPVKLEDLAELPSAPPPAEPVGAGSAPVPSVAPEESELESLPPVEVRPAGSPQSGPEPSSIPDPVEPTSPVQLQPPAPVEPVNPSPSPPTTLAPPGGVAPPRPHFNPLASLSATRATSGSLPIVPSPRPPPSVVPEEVAAVGAVFDEFLVSAPVEPPPRPMPPIAPRALPSIPTGPRRAPSMQVPVFRPMITGSAPPRLPPPLVADAEAIEPLEVEEVEVEEIVAPVFSRAPPPLASRPPAPPPPPPKKR